MSVILGIGNISKRGIFTHFGWHGKFNAIAGMGNANSERFPPFLSTWRNFSHAESQNGSNGKDNVEHASLKPPKEIPYSVFRTFTQDDEQLGPGADKNGEYKNAEYYGYHKYSWGDIFVEVMRMRQEKADMASVKCVYEAEEENKKDSKETKGANKEKEEKDNDEICIQTQVLPEAKDKVSGDPAQSDECGLTEKESLNCSDENSKNDTKQTKRNRRNKRKNGTRTKRAKPC